MYARIPVRHGPVHQKLDCVAVRRVGERSKSSLRHRRSRYNFPGSKQKRYPIAHTLPRIYRVRLRLLCYADGPVYRSESLKNFSKWSGGRELRNNRYL